MMNDYEKGDLVSIEDVLFVITKIYRDERDNVWKVTCRQKEET